MAEQNEVISALEQEYNSLGEDSNIVDRLDGEFRQVESSDVKKVKKFNMSQRKEQEEPSNWFEEFCEKLRNLF